MSTTPKAAAGADADTAVAPPTGEFDRSLGLLATVALGFTYLSPLGAVAILLPLGLTTAGPPSIWWLLIVALGQLTVALIFGEVVSQYPITGGIYPWARRLWGRRYAWMAAWIYLCALVVTIASVVEFSTVVTANLFGFELTSATTLLLVIVVLMVALVINVSGTRALAMAAKIGFGAEVIGVVSFGLYLLLFQRHNSIGVLFDTMGVVGANGSYLGAFLLASLVGLFLFYGFEACGDVAEEVTSPSREIPKAMIWTVVVGFMSAFLAFIGFILAAPNLQAILDGEIADPVSAILDAVMGHFWSKVFLAIALTAIMSCVLSLQAALSRLIFAFARDKMLPGHAALSKLTRDKTPRNALLLASLAPMVLGVWVFIYPSSLPRVTAFGVIGIYVCFQMVVLAALRQRVKGWKPAGKFSLGALGPVLNVVALLYGIAGIVVLALPGDADLAFADRWVVLLGLATVIVMGAVYLVIAKPYRHSDEPEGDAVEVAQAIRSGKIRLS